MYCNLVKYIDCIDFEVKLFGDFLWEEGYIKVF